MGKTTYEVSNESIEAAYNCLMIQGISEAKGHLRIAIDNAMKVIEVDKQRTLLNYCTYLCQQAGFLDYALEAIQSVLRIDQEANLASKNIQNDLLTYGNIQVNLGNLPKALGAFEKALDICLAQNDFADAASCSTNLGYIF
ncbi:MAG TPA: hypothetical protein VGQ04_06390, partial [Chitinophagaceae bacterium]|nr:hypothetical protein [Chitinophagaceae bacterium]